MLVLAETPANPQLSLVDLDELGAIRGPFTVVDSTFATPVGQQPLAHGVNLVVHSATKGIAGHNDATLGVINIRQSDVIKIFSVVAFVFLPPTLVASIYGMNFDYMPELSWPWGYPMALGMMVLSALVPYLFFRWKKWL